MLRALAFAFALLLAQQSALSHALWHLDEGHSHEDGQALLCPLHAALGTVCGSVDVAAPSVSLQEVLSCRFAALQPVDAGLPAPTPSSRDPPRFSLK